jgi:hypothetical protein
MYTNPTLTLGVWDAEVPESLLPPAKRETVQTKIKTDIASFFIFISFGTALKTIPSTYVFKTAPLISPDT